MKWIPKWRKKPTQVDTDIDRIRSQVKTFGGIQFVSHSESAIADRTCGFVLAFFNPDYIRQQPWGAEIDYDCYAVEDNTAMATGITDSMLKLTAVLEKDGEFVPVPVYSLVRYVPILSSFSSVDSVSKSRLYSSPGYVQESKVLSWPDDDLESLYHELVKLLGGSEHELVVRECDAPILYRSLLRKVMFNVRFLSRRDYERQELTYRLHKGEPNGDLEPQ